MPPLPWRQTVRLAWARTARTRTTTTTTSGMRMRTTTELVHTAELLGLMAHPTRLSVLVMLAEDGAQSVGALAEALDVEQTALSHHLRALREGGLVLVARDGRRRIYRLADGCVARIVQSALIHSAELTGGGVPTSRSS